MTVIEVNYKVKRNYCVCCNRPLDKVESTNKTGKLDLSEMMQYAPIGGGDVYIEDLTDFVGVYLFDYYGEYLNRDEVASFSEEEEKKVLEGLCNLLKGKGFKLI